MGDRIHSPPPGEDLSNDFKRSKLPNMRIFFFNGLLRVLAPNCDTLFILTLVLEWNFFLEVEKKL